MHCFHFVIYIAHTSLFSWAHISFDRLLVMCSKQRLVKNRKTRTSHNIYQTFQSFQCLKRAKWGQNMDKGQPEQDILKLKKGKENVLGYWCEEAMEHWDHPTTRKQWGVQIRHSETYKRERKTFQIVGKIDWRSQRELVWEMRAEDRRRGQGHTLCQQSLLT